MAKKKKMPFDRRDMELRSLSRQVRRQREVVKDAKHKLSVAECEIDDLKEMNRRINISRGQLRKRLGNFERRFTAVSECKEIQCQEGNYTEGQYMRGMANGLIFAVATMKGEAPKYFDDPPKKKTKRKSSKLGHFPQRNKK